MKSVFKIRKERKLRKKNKVRRELIERFSVGEVSNYGCTQVTYEELPNYVNDFISETKMNRPIKVSRRKNCMTSSGRFLYCHANVEQLVRMCGGQRMVGYMVQNSNLGECDFIAHSVWVTPEKRLVDVTQRDPHGVHFNTDFRDFQYFIPVSIKKNIYLKDIYIDKILKRNND